MFLVKCKCGCFFTVKKESLSRYNLQCQNCKEKIHLFDSSSVLDSSKDLEASAITVNYIPDDSKITVTFNA